MLLLVSSSHIRDHSDGFKTAPFTTKLLSHATIFPYFLGTDFRTHPGAAQCCVFYKEDTCFPRAKQPRPGPPRAASEYRHPRLWQGTGPATLRLPSTSLRMRRTGTAAKAVASAHAHASLPPTLPPRPVRAAAGSVLRPLPCSPCPLPVLPRLSRGWGNSALGATSSVTWLGSQRCPARDRLAPRRLIELSPRGPAGRAARQAPLPSSLVASPWAWSGGVGAVRRSALSVLWGPVRAGNW